jgi:hypothetical protein
VSMLELEVVIVFVVLAVVYLLKKVTTKFTSSEKGEEERVDGGVVLRKLSMGSRKICVFCQELNENESNK